MMIVTTLCELLLFSISQVMPVINQVNLPERSRRPRLSPPVQQLYFLRKQNPFYMLCCSYTVILDCTSMTTTFSPLDGRESPIHFMTQLLTQCTSHWPLLMSQGAAHLGRLPSISLPKGILFFFTRQSCGD